MALTPKSTAKRVNVDGIFSHCTLSYAATSGGKSTVIDIGVSAGDVSNNHNPTNDQLLAVANPIAIAVYNKWVENLSAAPAVVDLTGLPTTPLA